LDAPAEAVEGGRIMVCSYYEVLAYNAKRDVLSKVVVFSFDDAYYFIDQFRERYPSAVEFTIKCPDEKISKMEEEQ